MESSMLSRSTFAAIAVTFCIVQSAVGAVFEHSFTVTGDNGETGSGSFIWDDTTLPSGSFLTEGDLISFSLLITGGNVVGGSDSFTRAHCPPFIGVAADSTPDFGSALSFNCDNTTNRIQTTGSYTHELSAAGGAPIPLSELTMVPGLTTQLPPLAFIKSFAPRTILVGETSQLTLSFVNTH